MFKLQKKSGQDLTVLILGDPQVDYEIYGTDLDSKNMIRVTVDEVMRRVKPDLIATTGDLADEYGRDLYEYFIGYLDSFGIPWTTVMGNHDQEGDADTREIMGMLKASKNCHFDEGDPALGYGHFTITVEEEGRPVSSLILMDSHRRQKFINEKGEPDRYIVPFTEAQIDWYREQVSLLRAGGCPSSTLLFHIPLHEFSLAWDDALRVKHQLNGVLPWEASAFNIWNEGYEDSFGINFEKIACHPESVKLFDAVLDMGHTKNIICGHDHKNCASVSYRGVRLTYALKTGCGGYYDTRQNGCTVLTVGDGGTATVHHEYVDMRKAWYKNRSKGDKVTI
ncbi:MAG: metallophosphoesterase [Clostridia bacterium]|nr:metallophosphoesterase [Clostridia bacterium]